MRRELGELALAGQVRLTPAPQAHSAVTGRSPGVMMPWLSAFMRIRNTVSCATAPESR